MNLHEITRELVHDLEGLTFAAPVAHIYNPLVYAAGPHGRYLDRFGRGPREVVLLGMNPGPFGMVQTGVPFGDVKMVRGWMGLVGKVEVPPEMHPKRPVLGFECRRSEVSGSRLWGWARDRFGPPERFFERFYVANYCPLCFMEDSGRNRTPDKLPAEEKKRLFAACDRALARTIEALDPRFVLGIGAFAEARIRAAIDPGARIIGRIPHPSPASPLANRGWAEAAEAALRTLGINL